MLALLLLLHTAPCLASQDGSAQLSEYHRLHTEMDRLASRQAWSGVERTWQALLATGMEPNDDDLVTAAHAARALGDLAAARARLVAVAQRTESRDVIETLFRIDHEYGLVELVGATELVIEEKPFLPEAAAAVALASEQVAATGRFEGHLPPGRYRFGMEIIEVQAGEKAAFDVTEPQQKRRAKGIRTW
jgi:hypothetical protein